MFMITNCDISQIHTGNDECAHARIFHPLPGQGEPSLHSVQLKKTREEELAYF